MLALADRHRDLDRIVHLAAQPGVRHSLVDPYVYVQTNVMGHLVMLELARLLPGLKHFVYASSSSVYGGNRKLPFATADRVDHPVSLYAATKRADELLSETYAHLFGLRRPACAISRSTDRGAGPTCRRTSSPRRSTRAAPSSSITWAS